MEQFGFYVIKDEFFEKFNDPYLKGNKDQNRSHYYCFKDEADGLYWIIPMSSRVEKYKAVIAHKKEMHKPCDLLYVCKLSNDKENAFLVQDMFPITEKYILRPYTFAGNPLKLINETDRQIIESKAIRILRTCLHKHMRTSFRQILPQTALKILAGRQPACGFLPCLQQNYARKSAHISYEDRF